MYPHVMLLVIFLYLLTHKKRAGPVSVVQESDSFKLNWVVGMGHICKEWLEGWRCLQLAHPWLE